MKQAIRRLEMQRVKNRKTNMENKNFMSNKEQPLKLIFDLSNKFRTQFIC